MDLAADVPIAADSTLDGDRFDWSLIGHDGVVPAALQDGPIKSPLREIKGVRSIASIATII